jgi:hypothetical protein
MTEQPKVPTERPDPEAAAKKPGQSEDRPGFDLGGSSDEAGGNGVGSGTIPGGPKGDVAVGTSGTGSRGSGGGGGGSGGGGAG